MSYLKRKVAEVRSSPVPGKYVAPITVHLVCDTPKVTILYTTDGSMPIANSTRSHGFQSTIYNNISAILLKTGGVHVISAVAQRDGYVSSKVAQFKFFVEGAPPQKMSQSLGDAIIERRFMAMTSLDPPMPLRLARARTPNLTCALVDTCPRDVLLQKRREGQELALFELTHNSRSVSRQDTYRRIVAPSMSVALPQLPNKVPPPSPNHSLRSSMSSRFALTTYERPTFRGKSPRIKKGAGSVVVTTSHGIRECFNYNPPKSAAKDAADRQLCWFENRTGLASRLDDDYDDPIELSEAKEYAEKCATTMQKEVERMSRSPLYARSATPNAVGLSEDIASASKGLLHTIHAAKELCHSDILRLLKCIPYTSVAAAIQKSSTFSPGDLAGVSEGSLSVAEASKSLGIVLGIDSSRVYDTKHFLLLCRYAVWASVPIPEAIFGLAVQHWKAATLAGGGTEAKATRIEVMAILDVYRRTRGAHLESAEELFAKGHALPWGEEDGDHNSIPYGVFHRLLTMEFPVVDSRLVEMNNMAHAMYHRPLQVW